VFVRAGVLHVSRGSALARLSALPVLAAVMLSADVSYGVRTVTALAAAAVLLRTARLHSDRLRWPRRLFAAALLVGAGSGVASAIYLLVAGHAAPIGSFSDWLYLCYAPLAVAAVLAVPRASRQSGGTVRALADGAVAAGSLWYVTVALFVGPAHLGTHLGPTARGVTLAFPLLPAFVAAVILSALPRVARPLRPFLLRAGAGLVFLGVGDIAVAIASWGGWYRPNSWIAAVSELGLLLMLDAAIVTSPRLRDGGEQDRHADVQATSGSTVVGAPYAPLLGALGVVAYQFAAGRGISHGQLVPVIVIGVAVVVRHVASTRETGRLVARLAAREKLARAQAMSDPLTGLANRTAFLESLDAGLLDPTAHQIAVALLDLNDFKDINDTYGHATGDEVLRRTAALLEHAVPAGCVARLGGDEFAIFVSSTTDGGHALAATISAAFANPIRIGDQPFVVRASVGVVVDERPPGASRRGDGVHLLAHADVAMYEAKRSKHLHAVSVAVLTGRDRIAATATIRIREEVSHPDLSQFRVEYQPVVDLHSGAIVAAEALIRWRHPEFGEIGPATFIPLAERVGSVGELGDFVMGRALDDLATWSTDSTFAVGVNVSPRQLADPSLTETATAMLRARGLLPGQLSLEVTEEAFADDIEAVVHTIAALRSAGIWVAVDDFGTGYSSLSYLRRFDANIVKIDKEFVQACITEPRTDALVRSVVAMAAALDLTCVAEGIETLEQLAHVRANGCQFGQGFVLARPMPAHELGRLLDAHHTYPVDVQTPSREHRAASRSVVPLRGAG
jgi:diguanylate cyclase (GGDEF)-like protein